MIGGGGSGGTNIAGGGGAGAVMSGSSLTMPANTYTITVGAGGVGRTSLGPLTSFPANDTTIVYPGPHTITAQRVVMVQVILMLLHKLVVLWRWCY